MTIAACFLTPGGVVLGADSTSTIQVEDHAGQLIPHYYDHAQKVFEVGEGSTLGIVTWGLAGFSDVSYRRLFAELADEIEKESPGDIEAAAALFSRLYWASYDPRIQSNRARIEALEKIQNRSQDEENELSVLLNVSVAGFCLAGRIGSTRDVTAFELIFEPQAAVAPTPRNLPSGNPHFWGVPLLTERLIYGLDEQILERIASSPKWSGSKQDILDLVEPSVLRHAGAFLPLREAIDYIHACIMLTCKGIKFSQYPPFCGGNAEIATITADRGFRWVRHKTLDEAL